MILEAVPIIYQIWPYESHVFTAHSGIGKSGLGKSGLAEAQLHGIFVSAVPTSNIWSNFITTYVSLTPKGSVWEGKSQLFHGNLGW